MDSGKDKDHGKGPVPAYLNGSSRPTNDHPGTINNVITVQPPRREDLQPSYAQTLLGESEDAGSHGWYGTMSMSWRIPTYLLKIPCLLCAVTSLGSLIGTCGAIPCCFICPNPYKPVSQGNVGLVTKFGRFYRAVDPGLVKINPLSERLIQVDVKIQIVGTLPPPSVQPTIILTSDAQRSPSKFA